MRQDIQSKWTTKSIKFYGIYQPTVFQFSWWPKLHYKSSLIVMMCVERSVADSSVTSLHTIVIGLRTRLAGCPFCFRACEPDGTPVLPPKYVNDTQFIRYHPARVARSHFNCFYIIVSQIPCVWITLVYQAIQFNNASCRNIFSANHTLFSWRLITRSKQ